ncbi:MAG: RagB/SusD family nutrient uptake outer membrane protein [Ferruginibacter sp.]
MKIFKQSCLLIILFANISCKKYLAAKPDAKLEVPTSLNDLQALLDNYKAMNVQIPGAGAIFTDDYYLSTDDWSTIYDEYQRNYYIWQKDDDNIGEWDAPYNNIFTCNLVLETLPSIKVNGNEKIIYENIKGAALFFRATYFYGIAQLFTKGYDSKSANEDLGIPLRTSTSLKEKVTRATIKQTYEQIVSDFKNAITLLPVSVSIKSRPCKAAGYGALARTYLAMEDYENADLYADSCLALYNTLIDYNTLDSNSANPIDRFNDEVIFQSVSLSEAPLDPAVCKIDSNLYKTFDLYDLRRVIYFFVNGDGSYSFKGDYDGGSENYGHSFTGIVTDEQYLIKAECAARLGRQAEALKYLNDLLSKRFISGHFLPVTINDPNLLLGRILNERRKELIFRGIRLTDLKRLNKDPRFSKVLYRNLSGVMYELPPNDNRYVAQLPKTVVIIGGVKQNP